MGSRQAGKGRVSSSSMGKGREVSEAGPRSERSAIGRPARSRGWKTEAVMSPMPLIAGAP